MTQKFDTEASFVLARFLAPKFKLASLLKRPFKGSKEGQNGSFLHCSLFTVSSKGGCVVSMLGVPYSGPVLAKSGRAPLLTVNTYKA